MEDSIKYLKTLPINCGFWDGIFQCASENFVLSEIFGFFIENVEAFNCLPTSSRDIVTSNHALFKILAIRQCMQIAQIAQKIDIGRHGHLTLIKGACSRFNKLYPSNARRTMSDIDCLFYNPDILQVFSGLNYQPIEPGSIDLVNPDPSLFERAHGLPRHLPGIFCNGHPVAVELHLCSVRFEFAKYLPENFDDDIVPVPTLPNIFVPSDVNQFILLIIHSNMTDRMLHLGGMKLRSLHEGFLRYRALTEDERDYITKHFSAVGLKYELRRWLYICGVTFEDSELMGTATLRLRLSYLTFSHLNQRQWFIFLRYVYFLFIRSMKHGLARKNLRKKIMTRSWWKHKLGLLKGHGKR